MADLAIPIRLRNDSSASWAAANPTLKEGEVGLETNTGRFKVGNNATAYNSLDYFTSIGPFPLYGADSTTPPTAANNARSLVWFNDLAQPGYCDGTSWYKINGVAL